MHKAIPTTAAHLSHGNVIIVRDTMAPSGEVLALVTNIDRATGSKFMRDFYSLSVIPLNLTEEEYGRFEDEFDRNITLEASDIVHLAGHLSTPAIQHLVGGLAIA